MVKQKKSIQEVMSEAEPVAVEVAAYKKSLHARLQEIKKCEGVIGFILRNTTSASVDLNDPTKVIEYAILSSMSFDAAGKFSSLFDLGDIKNVVVEGKNFKMLSVTADENKISIFMEKETDPEKILEELLAS
jgi:predicted regulator of Ras-like GTPase activity (Roadblock/LC7/MglB family)